MSVDYGLSYEVGVCASMHEPNKPWNIKTMTHTYLTGWCPEHYVCWFMFIQLTDNKVILKIQRATIVTAPLFSLVHIPYYTPFTIDISQQLLLWHTKEKLLGHLPRNPHWIPTKSQENHHRINSNFCKSRNLGNHGNRGNHPGRSPFSWKSPRPFHRQSHKKNKRKNPVALALHLGRRELLIHQGGVHDLKMANKNAVHCRNQ